MVVKKAAAAETKVAPGFDGGEPLTEAEIEAFMEDGVRRPPRPFAGRRPHPSLTPPVPPRHRVCRQHGFRLRRSVAVL